MFDTIITILLYIVLSAIHTEVDLILYSALRLTYYER